MNDVVHTQQIERQVLGWTRWILPFVLAIVFPVGKTNSWAFIGMDPSLVGFPSGRVLLVYGLFGVLLGVGVSALWSLSLRAAAFRSVSWRTSVLGALALVVLADVLVRSPVVVDALWAAIRARALGPEDFFIREVALFRRMALTNERPSIRPRAQVVGSSQLIMGVDYDLLQQLRPDIQVERRSVAAMGPARLLMAAPYLGTRVGDTIVVYWSEFDMGGMTSLDVDWYRPFSNAKGLREVLAHLPRGEWLRDFRKSVELFWGSGSELWRSRDAWRLVQSRTVGLLRAPAGAGSVPVSVVEGQVAGYAAGLTNDAYFEMGLRAACRLLAVWKNEGARVVVMEGSVNPVMHKPSTESRRRQVRAALEAACGQTGALYIPADEQDFKPGVADWADGTHLNRGGRELFTRYLAGLVLK